MLLVGKTILASFKEQHPDAKAQIEAWETEIESAEWKTPHDLKERFPKASLPGKGQAIFNICWNKYRLWVKVAYNASVVTVKAIGTHKQYDTWEIK